MVSRCELVDVVARPTLVVRTRTAVERLPQVLGPAWGEVPAGKAVQCIHAGPCDQLGATYGAMRGWMAEHGLRHAGPAREFYLDDPQDTPPAEVRTRVVLPAE